MNLVRRILARLISEEAPPLRTNAATREHLRQRRRDDLLAGFLGGAEVVRLEDYRNGRGSTSPWTT